MRKLIVFESISLDGFFTDRDTDMGWAHAGGDDPEFAAFTAQNAKAGGLLVFGRVTYEMMASFWPTPMAAQQMPEVAKGMNAMPKLVFSRSLKSVSWNNTALAKGAPADEIAKLKKTVGPDMAVLGSGSIVAQLAKAKLVDEYQMVVTPVILGAGRTLFEGVTDRQGLEMTRSRVFKNGKTFLAYRPA